MPGHLAGLAGFVLMNSALLIGGGLVGASGLILTLLMCTAMNRTLGNVLFGAVGSVVVTGGPSAYAGKTPKTVHVKATKEDGSVVEFDAVVRIDTPGEADYYRNGGILQYVLRSLAS